MWVCAHAQRSTVREGDERSPVSLGRCVILNGSNRGRRAPTALRPGPGQRHRNGRDSDWRRRCPVDGGREQALPGGGQGGPRVLHRRAEDQDQGRRQERENLLPREQGSSDEEDLRVRAPVGGLAQSLVP